MKSFLLKLWFCWIFKDHDWTCAAAKGIPATPEQLASGIDGFWDYATMYCDRCGKISDLSKKRSGSHE